jgi:hypothetical protein
MLKKLQSTRPNQALYLEDFKLKKDPDGWIRLPVIGQQKGMAEKQALVARDMEVSESTEQCFVATKETQEELDRKWKRIILNKFVNIPAANAKNNSSFYSWRTKHYF